MVNRVIRLTIAIVVLAMTTTGQDTPVLSVCDVIRNPEKWEGKIVAVKGALSLGFGREPAIDGVRLTPVPPETCSNPSSRFVSNDEPPEIELRYPDVHFLASSPKGYRFRESTLSQAKDQLVRLKKRTAAVPYAKVTVDGFIDLRKYNLRAIQKN